MGGAVINFESEEACLRNEYEQLTMKLHKQKHILSVVNNIDCNDISNVNDTVKKNIDKALDFVRAYDYLKIDNVGTNVLGIIPDKPYELSYVEKRALKAKVLDELPKSYSKELEFCRKMVPEVIEPDIFDSQIMDLNAREKDLFTELAANKVALCETLVDCIELRFGPYEKNTSELTKAKISVERVKAQLINTLLDENMNSMSEHVNKAMDKIEFILDCAIEKQYINDAVEMSDSR
ncbi:uncharacterized protein LOC116342297 [Contarinia nasturtii]|uniref:uncharacterized protein LOC116342297 n=1 Tax=Contarinia nasturtii TaxID=265458 RepID=UPI0012D487B1|nr:uncharacterized protein LOC116342297 [Contarinia nasturtii]XP_031625681.1 uncharacterized protein LOC116342297 [Contarinia nasturtii]